MKITRGVSVYERLAVNEKQLPLGTRSLQSYRRKIGCLDAFCESYKAQSVGHCSVIALKLKIEPEPDVAASWRRPTSTIRQATTTTTHSINAAPANAPKRNRLMTTHGRRS